MKAMNELDDDEIDRLRVQTEEWVNADIPRCLICNKHFETIDDVTLHMVLMHEIEQIEGIINWNVSKMLGGVHNE